MKIMLSKEQIKEYQTILSAKTPQEVISWAIDLLGVENVALASSLGAEDQVLTDIIMKITRDMNIFTLDTGRLPQETYDLIEKNSRHYNRRLEILFPERRDVEKMVNEYGVNLFYESVENRMLCCRIRKVEPLQRKLSSLQGWFCGLRREQAATRKGLEKIEWDNKFNLVKINPLADWGESEVWNYIREKNLPYNSLHDKGYPSIGCTCCTRGVAPGDDIRSGRWWWESSEHKECGLHLEKR